MTVVITPPPPGLPGVKDEVAAGVHRMLERGVRYFGSAGASLTHHANDPGFRSDFGRKVVKAGMRGERETSAVVRRWMQDRPDAVLVDSAHIRGMDPGCVDREALEADGDGPDTDHVLIVGRRVVLIDSKRWRGSKSYKVDDKGVVVRGSKAKGYRRFPGGRVHARQACRLWERYLGGQVQVSAAVCISSPKVFAVPDRSWRRHGFRLVTLDNLPGLLGETLALDGPGSIDAGLVAQVAVCAIKPYDAYRRLFDMDQLRRFS